MIGPKMTMKKEFSDEIIDMFDKTLEKKGLGDAYFERLERNIKEHEEAQRERELYIDEVKWILLIITTIGLLLAISLRNMFDEEGRALFHKVSSFYPNYDYDETDSEYSAMIVGQYRYNSDRLFEIAAKYGLIPPYQKVIFENKRDNYRCVAYPFYLYYTIGEKPQSSKAIVMKERNEMKCDVIYWCVSFIIDYQYFSEAVCKLCAMNFLCKEKSRYKSLCNGLIFFCFMLCGPAWA